ncbi:MAG: helix-turn-helix transcriptional regulator [Clostridia bacterium]|nr:helix-turn-helix transcriptional regulator [Clostridia bacterium]
MISDNIKKYRKENNLSQDELAEKLGVSRQSISLWETGQTQPTIENIIALARIFNVSTDEILDNVGGANVPEDDAPAKGKKKVWLILGIAAAAALIIGIVLTVVLLSGRNKAAPESGAESESASQSDSDATTESSALFETEESEKETESSVLPETAEPEKETESIVPAEPEPEPEPDDTPAYVAPAEDPGYAPENVTPPVTPEPVTTPLYVPPETTKAPEPEPFDLFTYCKDFAISKGRLNGDYCMYQQPATLYGGYEGEYFSISYWGDSNMVEFCLHCPLDETLSINFYLRMRGGYNHKYEYLSSRYFRSNGAPLRSASGYIDPLVFSDSYPLSCDEYVGSFDGQTAFLEESRVGMCDLIHCLKQFVAVENMTCGFSAFEFVNY